MPDPNHASPEWPIFPASPTRRARLGFAGLSSAIGRVSFQAGQFSTAMAAALSGAKVESIPGSARFYFASFLGAPVSNAFR